MVFPKLPRRAYLGLDLERPASASTEDAAAASAPSHATGNHAPGLVVVAVTEGGAAQRAGLRPGDWVISAAGTPTTDVVQVQADLARFEPGRPVRLQVRREGVELEFELIAEPMPLEPLPQGRLVLDEVTWRTSRLRAVWTFPDGEGPFPAVWLLPGSLWMSEEQPLRPWYPTVRLVQGLTALGFATLRVDRSGLGDSEGPPCTELDLAAELDQWRAALKHFCEHPLVHRERQFGYGRSLGGMLLPLVPGVERLTALAVWGTTAGPWHEAMLELSRWQYQLVGMQPSVLERTMLELERLQRLLYVEGLTPAEAHAMHPELARVQPANFAGQCVYARVAAFFSQLQRADVAGAWQRMTRPVLALSGSADWLCRPQDTQRVAALAPRGQALILPGLDHHMHRRESLAQAIREPWGGDFEPSATEQLAAFYRTCYQA